MYIYTVKYRSRNMSNTHEPGDKGERSIGVKGQENTDLHSYNSLHYYAVCNRSYGPVL